MESAEALVSYVVYCEDRGADRKFVWEVIKNFSLHWRTVGAGILLKVISQA